MSVGGGKYGGNSNHSSGAGSGGSNTVLRVVVEHMVYPVTLDVIYQIFSRVGKVLKIVTFTKNNTFQVLIQFPDVITAQAAKLSLDGQNIYNGCCTLRIEYSKLPNLNVKYNNDKSRDYTNPGLPTGDQVMDALQSGYNGGGHGVLGSPFLNLGNQLAAAYGNSNLTAANLSGLTGFNLGAGSPFAQSGLRYASSASIGGSSGSGMGVNSQLQAAVAAAQSGSGTVLLVSNLNEDKTECDHLFILFGVYGDVQRVKILFNKKDTALIQMAEPQQALLVIYKLSL
jgi:polypyrimidine tract-binding protein 2